MDDPNGPVFARERASAWGITDFETETGRLAERMARHVIRTSPTRAGFAAADLGVDLTPQQFRSILVGSAGGLDRVYRRDFSRRLVPWWLGRFDQRASAEAHRDGGPDESILLLGYEPTAVDSRLFLIDSTKHAADHGADPAAPAPDMTGPKLSAAGVSSLAAYTTEVMPFDRNHFRIVAINNSAATGGPDAAARGMLGVLHKAVVPGPSPAHSRYVNSIMLAAVDAGTRDPIDPGAVRAFVVDAQYVSA